MGNAMQKRILNNILVHQPVLSIYDNMTVKRPLLILAGYYIVGYKAKIIDGPEGHSFIGKLCCRVMVMLTARHVQEREYNG